MNGVGYAPLAGFRPTGGPQGRYGVLITKPGTISVLKMPSNANNRVGRQGGLYELTKQPPCVTTASRPNRGTAAPRPVEMF
jgi:hypothetical protein